MVVLYEIIKLCVHVMPRNMW